MLPVDDCTQEQPFNLQELPAELLAQILRHVPQQQRLSQCALVCRRWAAAATAVTTAATVSIVHKNLCETKLTALNLWIAQHGTQASSLDLRWCCYPPPDGPLQLPCAGLPHLASLNLASLQVDLQLPDPQQQTSSVSGNAGSSSSSKSGRVAASVLPALRELQLSECSFTSSAALMQLPQLPCVTRLSLCKQAWQLSNTSEAALTLLPCLPQLAQLELRHFKSTAELLELVSSSLTYLCVSYCEDRQYNTK